MGKAEACSGRSVLALLGNKFSTLERKVPKEAYHQYSTSDLCNRSDDCVSLKCSIPFCSSSCLDFIRNFHIELLDKPPSLSPLVECCCFLAEI